MKYKLLTRICWVQTNYFISYSLSHFLSLSLNISQYLSLTPLPPSLPLSISLLQTTKPLPVPYETASHTGSYPPPPLPAQPSLRVPSSPICLPLSAPNKGC